MWKKVTWKQSKWLAIIAGELFLGCLLCLFMINKQSVNYTFSAEENQLLFQRDDKEELGFYTDYSYSGNFKSIDTPYIKLNPGIYEIKVEYTADAEGNYISVINSNTFDTTDDVYNKYLFQNVPLKPGEHEVIYKVWIDSKINDFRIKANYGNAGYLLVNSITLRTPESAINVTLPLFIYGCIILLINSICFLIGKNKRFSIKNRTVFWGLIFVSFLTSFPLLLPYLINSQDLTFHLMRIEGIKDGLLSGAFPVKISPTWIMGYGYANSVFYGDLLLYFPALLRMVGVPVQTAYKIFAIGINIGTTLISYYCFSRISKDKVIGLLGSALYTFSIYRLIDLYIRSAVGEYSAMMFLPLVVLGFWSMFMEDPSSKEYHKNWIILVIGLTGIVQTHLLTGEMTAIFILIICVVEWKKVINIKVFKELAKSASVFILLNLWFLVPFFDYMKDPIKINDVDSLLHKNQDAGMLISQFFTMIYSGYGNSNDVASGLSGEMPIGMGFSLLIGFLMVIFLCLSEEIKEKKEKRIYRIIILLSILAMWMSTNMFPYDKLSGVGKIFAILNRSIQFPWRFLSIATILTAVLCCLAMNKYKEIYGKNVFAGVAVLLCSFCLVQGTIMLDNFQRSYSPTWLYDEVGIQTDCVANGEYLPVNTMIINLKKEEFTVSKGCEIIVANHFFNSYQITCQNNSNMAEGFIEVPLLYYRGYRAFTTQDKKELYVTKGENNKIRVALPVQYDDTFEIKFHEPWYWRVAEVISLFVLIIIGAHFLHNEWKIKRKEKENATREYKNEI